MKELDLNPGKEVREDLSHEDWDDKPEPVEWASPHGSGSFQLISDEEQAGGLPTESQSGGSEPPSIPQQVEPAKAANPPVKALFDDVPADEVPPPLGPLVVVASIRKTGNPPKRKLHLLDRRTRLSDSMRSVFPEICFAHRLGGEGPPGQWGRF